ncbi:hypothetical protein vseg_009354 [Gypsophila vaccaria]
MAGWSNIEDNLCIRRRNESLKFNELCLVELVSGFLKGSSCSGGGGDCFRPVPPRLGNGDRIDLLELFFVVRQKGGFEAISEANLWGEVSLQCGLGSRFGSAFKLIYSKYLGSLESWLLKLVEEKSSESDLLMELERNYRSYVSKSRDVNRRGSDGSCSFKLEKSGVSFVDNDEDDDDDVKLGWKKLVMDFADSEGSNEGNEDEVVKFEQHYVKMCFMDDQQSTVKSKQLKGVASFADAGDSSEGKCESVDSMQRDVAMDSANDDGVTRVDHGDENLKRVKSELSSVNGLSPSGVDLKKFAGMAVVGLAARNVVKSPDNSVAYMKYPTEYSKERVDGYSAASTEDSSQKRKRDGLSGMLEWMANVAKNPVDPAIGEIPDFRKWKSYGDDKSWKQVLLAREALSQKKNRARSAEQSVCQKKMKMHPSLFDHCENLSAKTLYQTEANTVRPRQRLEARIDMQPTASIYTSRPQQRVPVGKEFQAEVPEWTGVPLESDSKWLGTQTWPLEKSEKRPLIERDPIGKGRVDNCGCQIPGSTECVKFHVSEKRTKTRLELGSAFYAWNFDKMGELCSLSWTIEEEKKFRSIIKDNPQSMQKCFWEPMCKALPKKKWEDQVNYYYNVFMLRRRSYQNRHYPSDIDSGDDETDYRSTNNSIRHGSA